MNSFFVLACLAALSFANANYCDMNCGAIEHIGCSSVEGQRSSYCEPETEFYDISVFPSLRNLILHNINTMRNSLAAGKFPGFPKAAKMLTVQWNNETAKLATMNAGKCTLERDACHTTDLCENPGQDTFSYTRKEGENMPRTDVLINMAFQEWGNTYKEAKNPAADAASFPATSPYDHEHPASPSARMCIENNPFVGCGAIEMKDKFGLVCNYCKNVKAGEEVYKASSEAGSDCTRKNAYYDSLCSKADTDAYVRSLQKRS